MLPVQLCMFIESISDKASKSAFMQSTCLSPGPRGPRHTECGLSRRHSNFNDGFNINHVVLPLLYYTRPDQRGVVGILSISGIITFCQYGVPVCVCFLFVLGNRADSGFWHLRKLLRMEFLPARLARLLEAFVRPDASGCRNPRGRGGGYVL